MKKIIILLCVTAMLMSLCGCFRPLPSATHDRRDADQKSEMRTEAPIASEAPIETAAPVETEAPFVAPPLSECIGIYTEQTVNYSDGYNDYYATYQVPEILIDSSDAKRANDLIQTTCNQSIQDSIQSEVSKTSLFCMGIHYDAWIYDRYLSLVVTEENDWGCTNYLVFTFDLTDGSWLGNEEFAAYLGVDTGSLKDMISSSMLYHYDDMNKDLPDEYRDEFFYMQRNNQTNDEYVNDTELFIGRDGSVQMCCWITSIAGADAYLHLLPLMY